MTVTDREVTKKTGRSIPDLDGAFFIAKAAAQKMSERGHGRRFINVLSTGILRPAGRLPACGAAKGGPRAVTVMGQEQQEKHDWEDR